LTDQRTQLVLFSTDADLIFTLKQRFESDRHISAVLGTGPEVAGRYNLDALWLTPMQAEYFGVTSSLPPHLAKVFAMPAERRQLGLPRLLIAGVTLLPGKTYTSARIADLCVEALANAIAEYNRSHGDLILRVGSVPENLGLNDLHNTEAFVAVRQAFLASPEQSATHQVLDDRQIA
jgi:hypothetical protein